MAALHATIKRPERENMALSAEMIMGRLFDGCKGIMA
jgi:hypothetical protein